MKTKHNVVVPDFLDGFALGFWRFLPKVTETPQWQEISAGNITDRKPMPIGPVTVDMLRMEPLPMVQEFFKNYLKSSVQDSDMRDALYRVWDSWGLEVGWNQELFYQAIALNRFLGEAAPDETYGEFVVRNREVLRNDYDTVSIPTYELTGRIASLLVVPDYSLSPRIFPSASFTRSVNRVFWKQSAEKYRKFISLATPEYSVGDVSSRMLGEWFDASRETVRSKVSTISNVDYAMNLVLSARLEKTFSNNPSSLLTLLSYALTNLDKVQEVDYTAVRDNRVHSYKLRKILERISSVSDSFSNVDMALIVYALGARHAVTRSGSARDFFEAFVAAGKKTDAEFISFLWFFREMLVMYRGMRPTSFELLKAVKGGVDFSVSPVSLIMPFIISKYEDIEEEQNYGDQLLETAFRERI